VPSTVEKLGPSRVKLTIEIPFDELKPHLNKAYRDIAKQVNIPGFRKGKVPDAIIDQRVGRGYVLQEAINAALSPAYSKALEEAEVQPLDQPDIDVTKLEDGEVVEFTAEVDIRPDFEVPDLSTLSVVVDPLADTEKEVDERVETLRERFATSKDVKRKAKAGDVVTMDLTARIGGEIIEDGESEGVTYKIGSGEMLDGLDEAVTGLKAGEEKTFTSKLVGGSHEGEEAEVTVKIEKVSEQELPEVDDDFAQEVSAFDTVDEMRDDIRKSVEQQLKYTQMQQGRDKIVDELIEKTEMDLPEGVINHEVEDRKEQILNQLKQVGLTMETYLERVGDEVGANTPDEYWAELAENARKNLKASLILDKIADANEVSVSENDLSEMLYQRAMQNGTSPQEEANHMVEHGHFNEWAGQIRRNKALEIAVKAATVKDIEGKDVDITIPEVAEPEVVEADDTADAE
jgi:trigger factor